MLKEALTHLSVRRYYSICKYSYRTLEHGGHAECSYDELPPNMKEGILALISGIYRVQKMVFYYDINYVNHCMKDCCIKLTPFYKACGINKTFYRNPNLGENVDRDERLLKIRLEMIKIINRLLEYVTASNSETPLR